MEFPACDGHEEEQKVAFHGKLSETECDPEEECNDSSRHRHAAGQVRRDEINTILDARAGYFHIPLHPDSREKTAFRGPYGFYQFTRLPQGLATAPAIFQATMNTMLGDLQKTCAAAYMDDVIIYSRTLEDHVTHVSQVLNRIAEFGIKMSLDKSKFAMEEIEFLGRLLTRDGIRPDPKKIEKIVNYPKPTTVRELMVFKGMCSYHRRLIPGFSKIMLPLQEMINDEDKK